MKLLVLDMIDSPNKDSQLEYVKEILGRDNFARDPGIRQDDDPLEVEFREILVYRDGIIPEDVLWADMVVAGGSIHSVYHEMFWKEDLRRAYDLILEKQIPFHTICFGTQFLAYHLGEKVHLNPNGPEFGSVQVELTEAGRQHGLMPLVDGKYVHTSHSDCIERVPAGATLLAYNSVAEVQAFQFENAFAVQFHTDLPTKAMEGILELRKNAGRIILRDEDHYRQIKEDLPLGENAHSILRGFVNSNKS